MAKKEAAAATPAKPTEKAPKRKKAKRVVGEGVVHIHSTFNNTLVTITDQTGNVIAWSSAGSVGFKGSRKGTPFAAQLAADAAARKAMDCGVRSVQVHDRDVERAEAGQRVAVSLPGVERADVGRGEALVEPGAYPVSYRLDVALDELVPIGDNARVHVHHGAADLPARVARVGDRFAQLRLDRPVVAARGDVVALVEDCAAHPVTCDSSAGPRLRVYRLEAGAMKEVTTAALEPEADDFIDGRRLAVTEAGNVLYRAKRSGGVAGWCSSG